MVFKGLLLNLDHFWIESFKINMKFRTDSRFNIFPFTKRLLLIINNQTRTLKFCKDLKVRPFLNNQSFLPSFLLPGNSTLQKTVSIFLAQSFMKISLVKRRPRSKLQKEDKINPPQNIFSHVLSRSFSLKIIVFFHLFSCSWSGE